MAHTKCLAQRDRYVVRYSPSLSVSLGSQVSSLESLWALGTSLPRNAKLVLGLSVFLLYFAESASIELLNANSIAKEA